MTSFSIVTVVYNDVSHIEETMNSVIRQDYKQIEYILIDGESTDGTKEKIIDYIYSCSDIIVHETKDDRCYLEAINRNFPTLTFKFLSEKDNGIYDAMNKGIDLATNEWINFINCGDKFYSLSVLEQISTKNIQNYDVIYGDMEIIYIDQKIKKIKKTSHDLKKMYALFAHFGHPNCFIKTNILKNNYFDLSYKLASDYDLVYRLYKANLTFVFLDIIVVSFLSGGASDKYAFQSINEALKIALIYNSKNPSIIVKIYLYYFFAILKKIIKLYFPSKLIGVILKLARTI